MTDQTPQDEPREDEVTEAPEPVAEDTAPAPSAEDAPAAEAEAEAPAEDAPAAEADAEAPAEATPATAATADDAPATADDAPAPADDAPDEGPAAPRERPAIPGADLEVDIVVEGTDRYGEDVDPYADETEGGEDGEDAEEDLSQPIASVAIDLGADARYRATGKRKSAVARVTLRPGTGAYTINGRELDTYFPRATLGRTIRQPLEAVGLEEQMDVIARMHGGGVAAQAGALRHGISRALLEADPNLRGELKKRGFLTRDPRVKERKKAGLKKARKRPQFSKR